jgi:biotin transporter BioY
MNRGFNTEAFANRTFADCLMNYVESTFAKQVKNRAYIIAATNVLLVLTGTLYITLLSQVVIPLSFTPVMISLGTFSIFTMSAALGWKRAVCSSSLYAILGLCNVPVFQGWKTYTTSATMGYVIGYIFVAYAIGRFAQSGKDKKFLSSVITSFISVPLLYIPGVFWLMYTLNITSLNKGLEYGFYPFIIGDTLKMIASGLLMPGLWRVYQFVNKDKAKEQE